MSIGSGLYAGGAGSLLLAYAIQSMFLAMVNNSLAEMSTAYPVSGGFIRLAGHWVDDALGFMVGWNFLSVFLRRSCLARAMEEARGKVLGPVGPAYPCCCC